MKKYYCVAVESGSCSLDYERWEERENCGHKHKNIDTAQRCLEKLTVQFCGICGARRCYRHSSPATSAKWYHATIHDDEGRRVQE